MQDPLVEIGRIVNCHGVRGEVRVLLHNPDSQALDSLSEVTLRRPRGPAESRRVLSTRRHKSFVLLTLQGVASANDAEALVGSEVCVRQSDLPPSGPGEFYVFDLIGCAVRTESGELVGSVSDVLRTGSNDTCVVRDADRESLIPLIDDVVVTVDVERKEIVIRPLPGLLEP